MKRESKRIFIISLSLLLVLAAFFGGYKLFGKGFSFSKSGPPAVALKLYGSKSVMREHGVDPDNLTSMKQSLRKFAKHLKQADMFVDEKARDPEAWDKALPEARFYVELQLGSGMRLQSRPDSCPWLLLDPSMALAVERCMTAYFEFAEKKPGLGSSTVLMNL